MAQYNLLAETWPNTDEQRLDCGNTIHRVCNGKYCPALLQTYM